MAALPEQQSRTSAAIEAAWVAADRQQLSERLRASSIGEECDRRLWYTFRWAHAPEQIAGRVLRLFETGNIEEDRLVADLRKIGCDVLATDPETNEQFEVSFLAGHFTGHTDGEVSNLPEAPKTPHLLECKSHNDKSFAQLKRHGVQVSKPMHYAQMQGYMHGRHLTRALYIAVNKNDDEIWSERVEYDPVFALQLVDKAERIVTAERAPPKLHEDPAAKMAWKCGTCPAKGVCHDDHLPPRNCRTCLHSTPEMDGDARWSCALKRIDIGGELQRAGCADHLFMPSLVPGEQVDAADSGAWVAYVLRNGQPFVDGAPA